MSPDLPQSGNTVVSDWGTAVSTTATVYNAKGQVTRSTSATGGATDYEYDSLGRQVATIGPAVEDEITGELVRLRSETKYNSLGQTSETWTNIRVVVSAEGAVLSTSYADKQVTAFEYDELGRTTKTIYGVGTALESYVAQGYDDSGRVLWETEQALTGNANPLRKDYEYDAAGRLVAVELPAVADPQNGGTLTHPRYEYGYDAQENQTLVRDPLGRETVFTYDSQGHTLTRTLPEGQTEEFRYDDLGRQVLYISFEGVVTQSVYDPDTGRVAETRYFEDLAAYNANDPSEAVAYTYDAFGRQVEVVQDDDGDFIGTTTDQRVTENGYDALGQLVTVTSLEGVIHYEYDAVTGLHTRTWTGTTEANATTDTHYAYDTLGRLTSVTQDRRNGADIDIDPNTTGNQPEVTDYVYELLGNLAQVRLPNGVVSDYDYDALNRLELLREFQDSNANHGYDAGVDTVLAEYDYDLAPDGKRTGVTEKTLVGSVLQETRIDWLYDDLGRLTREVYDGHYEENPDDTSLDYTADYVMDLVGNRLAKKVDSQPTATQTVAYRSPTTAMAPENVDEATTYEYDANDRLLTEAKDDDVPQADGVEQTTTYGYDATQQTRKTVWQGTDTNESTGTKLSDTTYTYNLQGRMAQVNVDSDGNGDLEERYDFTYDASGIRVSQTATTDTDSDGSMTDETPVETKYLNDANNPTGYSQVLEEKDGSGNVTKSYTLGLDVIAQQAPSIANGGNLFLLYDGHGSTRGLVDATGQPLSGQVFRYDAFGNRLDSNTALTSLLYSGEQTDGTGLQYLRARYYDPNSGRFNRLDPFAGRTNDPQSLHKYLYCHANPITGLDPSGQMSLGGSLTTISVGTILTGMTIGGMIGAAGGLGFGVYNAAHGLYYGRMNLYTAMVTCWRYALRGAGYGMIGGAIVGGGWIPIAITVGTTGIAGALNRYKGNDEDKLLSVLPFLPYCNPPENWIILLRDKIKAEAAKRDLPPELIGSVLLYELYQYNILDSLGDEEVITGNRHSIGIAQLRVDNVRSWCLSQASSSDSDIFCSLIDPESSVELLAEAIAFMRTNYAKGSLSGVDVTATSWQTYSDAKKENVVRIYSSAKDLSWGQTHDAADMFGVYGLHRIESEGWLK